MRKTTTFTHPSELRPLSVWRFKRTRGIGQLALPETLGHEKRELWQQELNRYYYACGCDTGAKAVVLFALAAGAWCGWRWSHGGISPLAVLKWIGFAAVAGGVVGKVIGLAIAGRKLELLKREVIAAWKLEPVAPTHADILCG